MVSSTKTMNSHDSTISMKALVVACSMAAAYGFQSSKLTTSFRSNTARNVAVDPTVVTKKEFEDICGAQFDNDSLHERLKATNFLYPKHVEVIEDIAPIAGAMVDEIVSTFFLCSVFLVETVVLMRLKNELTVTGFSNQ
jgi:hypothetical protein